MLDKLSFICYIISMSDSSYVTDLELLCEDIAAISQLDVTWKDAHLQRHIQNKRSYNQHQAPICQAAKSQAQRLEQCSLHCNISGGPTHSYFCNCPFGVREIRIPVFIGNTLQGTLCLGPWRAAPTIALDADIQPLHHALPDQDDAYAEALARCVQARVQQFALAHAHSHIISTQHDQRLHTALQYIQEHVHLQLRAASVARVINLSTSRFIHWFKEKAGLPYRQHIQEAVLKQAAERLIHSRERILDIALDVGYHSASAFSAAFKHYYKCTPNAFRKQQLQFI